MISYRDRMFCCNPNCICDPDLRLTDEVRAAADAAGMGISVGDRCQAVGPMNEEQIENAIAPRSGDRWYESVCPECGGTNGGGRDGDGLPDAYEMMGPPTCIKCGTDCEKRYV